MSATAIRRDEHADRRRQKARVRGARRMVSQGLTLYYQSLVHRVTDDTPAYFEQVMEQARSKSAARQVRSSALSP